jgi:hypothetical protein
MEKKEYFLIDGLFNLSKEFKNMLNFEIMSSLFDRLQNLSTLGCSSAATMNQHPPVHHQGWMICDQETVFCWVPVSYLTMVVGSVGLFTTYKLGR